MTAVQFKPVAEKDVAVLADIARRAYLDAYANLWTDAGKWYVKTMYNETQLLSEILDPNVAYFLVYQFATLVGFIKLKKNYPLSINGSGLTFGHGEGSNIALDDALYIDRIYFVKAATGNGLGRSSFDFIRNLAVKMGRKALWLMVMDSSTDAIRFYKKQGFKTCGTWCLDFENISSKLRGMFIMHHQSTSNF